MNNKLWPRLTQWLLVLALPVAFLMADIRIAPFADDEVASQVRFLDYLRASVVRKVDGPDEEALRRRFVASETTLLGLVQHLTLAESFWFESVWLGAAVELPTGSMIVPDNVSTAQVISTYEARTARSNAAVAGGDPEANAAGDSGRGDSVTLRWILAHMVEETARHAGHADILRELIDGDTGR